MGLKASIEAAAKAAVLTDAADLQGLVGLGEILRQLAHDASAEGAPDIADRSNEAADLSELAKRKRRALGGQHAPMGLGDLFFSHTRDRPYLGFRKSCGNHKILSQT